jgi:uronate dehydrogenase
MKIAITGAAGSVGTGLRPLLLAQGHSLRLIDLKASAAPGPREEVAQLDIADGSAVAAALQNCDAVIHLAGCTSDAPWDDQIHGTIRGTVSVLEAMRQAGVKRLIYASSHHVMGLHPRGKGLSVHSLPRPDSRYGVGKLFGEGAVSLYCDKYDMQALCIRIGSASDRPQGRRRLGIWISWRDLVQLIGIGLAHSQLHCEVVYGISDTTSLFFDNRAAFALGFTPQDDARSYLNEVLAADPAPLDGSVSAQTIEERAIGGDWAGAEYEEGTGRWPDRLGL